MCEVSLARASIDCASHRVVQCSASEVVSQFQCKFLSRLPVHVSDVWGAQPDVRQLCPAHDFSLIISAVLCSPSTRAVGKNKYKYHRYKSQYSLCKYGVSNKLAALLGH